MRQAFINTLIELADTDKNIWLLTADMGFGLVEPFAEKFPKRYINVGVAEQNMIGVATGLALEDKRVFCYSIGNFPTMRCLEQIRNDICYHNLPVCIVSGGAGLWYGNLGMSHWALEDIAVMRCLPNMAVVSPKDAEDTTRLINLIYRLGQTSYLRMTRTAIDTGKPTGNYIAPEIALITTGGQMYVNALEASRKLESQGMQTLVINVSTLKPLSQSLARSAADDAKLVVTIEEHSKIGGLGSAVAEVLAGLRQHPPLVRLGTDDHYSTTAMSYEELLKANHLDVGGIVQEVLDALH